MKIVITEEDLETTVVDILRDMPDNQILLDHFLTEQLKQRQTPFVMVKTPVLLG